MYGIIYKISNSVNEKVYIGQTIRTIESRFKRHIHDALKNSDSLIHFHRAIRKYGADKFSIEQIDIADSQEELDAKEKYWIKYYDSILNGYNEASGGQGGNTYVGISEDRLSNIKQKIGQKNFGKNNGMSNQVKCKSVISQQELHFDTLTQCLQYFNIKNKEIVTARALHKNRILWHDEWLFSYEDDEYITDYIIYDSSTRKGTKTILKSETEELEFNSKNKAIQFLNSSKSSFEKDAINKGYTIYYLP